MTGTIIVITIVALFGAVSVIAAVLDYTYLGSEKVRLYDIVDLYDLANRKLW